MVRLSATTQAANNFTSRCLQRVVGVGSRGENSLQVETPGQRLILRNSISASPAGVLEGSGWIRTGGGWNNWSGVLKTRILCNEIREEGTGCS